MIPQHTLHLTLHLLKLLHKYDLAMDPNAMERERWALMKKARIVAIEKLRTRGYALYREQDYDAAIDLFTQVGFSFFCLLVTNNIY